MDKEQFIYKIMPTRPDMLSEGSTQEENEIISQHFNYLKDLTEAGIIVLAGRTLNTDASSFGIVIFYANSESEATDLMMNDPAVYNKVMTASLFPFRTSLLGV